METSNHQVSALIIRQWLREWDQVRFSDQNWRKKPEPFFYVFSLPANWLWRMSDIYRRQADRPRSEDPSIQRKHTPERSEEIGRFIQGGFPWSGLSARQKQSGEYRDLRMPGWLPTAIIANILPVGAIRNGKAIANKDTISIRHTDGNLAALQLPEGFDNDAWRPEVAPIEIIDGQHRLLAFEQLRETDGAFELPVVAFHDLDTTWQAYLFYTINIKPKRINASLAFDLYPILRTQDWLEQAPGKAEVYSETRAQELTELLWSHPDSPWYNRINMLGDDSKAGPVTQAAFIRSLIASFVKGEGRRGTGGLFGSELPNDPGTFLRWNRAQQAAFLILVWQCMADATLNCHEEWAEGVRSRQELSLLPLDAKADPAFSSDHSLLATDQGVRGILQVTNDMCYVAAIELDLVNALPDELADERSLSSEGVSLALHELQQHPVKDYLTKISFELVKFDWRTSSYFEPDDPRRSPQMAYKGSSGYKELRRRLILTLINSGDQQVNRNALSVQRLLRY